jgi:transcriptional regulator with XRE-family HTH domain
MKKLNDELAVAFEDHEYAHVYIQSHVLDRLAMQVYALRNQRGLNQTELAELSGIGQGKISKIETGDFESLNLKTLFKLAEALDVAPVVKFDRFTNAIDDVTELQVGHLNVAKRTDDLHARNRLRQMIRNPMAEAGLMDEHFIANPQVFSKDTGSTMIVDQYNPMFANTSS